MKTKNLPELDHPKGEDKLAAKRALSVPLRADTFDGKIHIEWDPEAEVTPIEQLPFFIQYLKYGYLFESWVDTCPLHYSSHNAPKKVDVLGSFLLSILS